MPLTRGEIVGHDVERMAFKFTMLNAAEVVNCQISDAALDDVAGISSQTNCELGDAGREMTAQQTENWRATAAVWLSLEARPKPEVRRPI